MNLTKLCKNWMRAGIDEKVREMSILRMKLNKPTMSGIIVNLRTGRTRKPKVGEVGLTIIDHSDPSLEDGDLVLPKGTRRVPKRKRKVIKHGKK